MDETREKKRHLKRAYKKAKRKALGPWKVLCILCLVVSLVATPLYAVLHVFDNTVAAFVGGTFWQLENEDPGAQYFTSDFDTAEEMVDYGLELCEQVEAEGAALLLNNNNALPLAKGAAVSCFSTSSVNLVYGGTGSGNIDASSADTLKDALEKAGFSVNETLWNFYTEGPGSEYLRVGGTGVLSTGAEINEAPWSVYTEDVISSVSEYGDAAIVVLSRVGGEGADLSYQGTNYLALSDVEKEMMQNVMSLKEQGAVDKIIVLINSANPLQVDFLKNNDYNVDACLWIGDSFHWRMPAKSIEAPGTRDENGPQGLTASLLGSGATQLTATAFTSEDVMAATFNTDLMYQIGNVIGNNCLQADIVCLYGPGNNIHRTPYGGRNFEYYSEDGFLSGKMSAYEVKGIQDKGVDVVMKHFALNDSEQDRIGLGVWLNEQAAREVYLKAFQAPFEEGNANGVMTAYTRWGATWSGGNKGLMTNIMRGEWGSDGMSITDNVLTTYVNGVDGIMAGGVTTFDAMLPYVTDQLPKYKDDAVIVNAMREACHRNLYALANSSGMNGVGPNTTVKLTRPTVVTMAQIISCAAIFFTLLSAVLWVLGVRKFRKTEEYKAFKAFKAQRKASKG